MKLGHAAPNPHRTPPLLNEIWEPTSLAYRVLCYYSTLLQGSSSRLRLVWQAAGYESFVSWQMGAEQHFLLLRRLILHAESWVERRLCMHYFDSREVWPLFATCDPRRAADHDAIITKLLSFAGLLLQGRHGKADSRSRSDGCRLNQFCMEAGFLLGCCCGAADGRLCGEEARPAQAVCAPTNALALVRCWQCEPRVPRATCSDASARAGEPAALAAAAATAVLAARGGPHIQATPWAVREATFPGGMAAERASLRATAEPSLAGYVAACEHCLRAPHAAREGHL